MAQLYRVIKGGTELMVEAGQLDRYRGNGWEFVADKPKVNIVDPAKPPVELIDVHRGEEVRRCTFEQLKMMKALGFETKKEKTDGRQQINPVAGHGVERLPDPAGERSPEVGLAGNPVPGGKEDAGLDDEPAAGPVIVTRASTKEEVLAAFKRLDPKDDSHWTKFHEARLEVLNAMLTEAGTGAVTRPQFNQMTGSAKRPV